MENIEQRIQSLFDSDLADKLEKNGYLNLAAVSISSAKTLLLKIVMRKKSAPILWLTEEEMNVKKIFNDLKVWQVPDIFQVTPGMLLGDKKIELAKILSQVHKNQACFVIATLKTLKNLKIPNAFELNQSVFSIETGKKLNKVDFFNQLIDMGYQVSPGLITEMGTYTKRGGIIDIFLVNYQNPLRIELDDEMIASIREYSFQNGESIQTYQKAEIYPIDYLKTSTNFLSYFQDKIIVKDELFSTPPLGKAKVISFLPFTEEQETLADKIEIPFHSVLRFHTPIEFTEDLRKRIKDAWKILIFSQDKDKLWNLLVDQNFKNEDMHNIELEERINANGFIQNSDLITPDLQIAEKEDPNISEEQRQAIRKAKNEGILFSGENAMLFPDAFQNSNLKILVITDREIFGHFAETKKTSRTQADAAFLAALNPGDLVVHIDHGIGRYINIESKTVAGITREYLNLAYAKGDKLFVPIEQADKINKYIGAIDENAPPLTRLGSAEWNTVTSRARKESLEIAKDLLELYALRESSKGQAFDVETKEINQFETDFPYVDTPGQTRTIIDVKHDMLRKKPMDRLVCGDVGFGKTEIAMRAAFIAVQNNRQVAMLAPITILVDQHFKSFQKRMAQYNIEIRSLSRFSSPAEQKETVLDLEKGFVDIVIGTHRLLQADVKFKNLGLVIIDEEQRFGVKQKEILKQMRHEVDILTLTATPVPRTLNMALSGLRDISTITTPPPGRLPIRTEVRRFSMHFIREVILRELSRKGQIFFLHNRVHTIEGFCDKLKILVPEAKFIVAHGQLPSTELEKRIIDFKNHKYDVLVSSTIIENGIDLPNANTLIVDRAERLGLSQAYQLRGRVGRGKKQAYAYFLYHSQKLDDTAKKRLRAIVEASELGSGFQIAMRDLEIRGAGDILGAKQHGSINAIGVSHFTRLLKKAVEELKKGKTRTEILEKPPEETTIELNLSAYIPDAYVTKKSEKLKFYQQLASCTDLDLLHELKKELMERYGNLPQETKTLIQVLELKIKANRAGILNVKESYVDGIKHIELVLSKRVKPEAIINLREYNNKWMISGQSLKIKIVDLGDDWFFELRKCLKKLGEKKIKLAENGAPVKKSISQNKLLIDNR